MTRLGTWVHVTSKVVSVVCTCQTWAAYQLRAEWRKYEEPTCWRASIFQGQWSGSFPQSHMCLTQVFTKKKLFQRYFLFYFFLIGALPTANLACVACLLTFTKCKTVVQLASVKCARMCLHVQSKSASLIIDKIFRQTFAVFPLTVFLTSKAVKILVLIL